MHAKRWRKRSEHKCVLVVQVCKTLYGKPFFLPLICEDEKEKKREREIYIYIYIYIYVYIYIYIHDIHA